MEIKIKDKMVLIDDEDYEKISKYKWYIQKCLSNIFYAAATIDGKLVLMQHLLLERGDKYIDHKNNNGLDNRKENLRLCTHTENMRNRKLNINSTTGFKGVSKLNSNRQKWTGRFCAGIRFNNKSYHIGCFDSPIKAALAYDQRAKKLFGEFAKLNFG